MRGHESLNYLENMVKCKILKMNIIQTVLKQKLAALYVVLVFTAWIKLETHPSMNLDFIQKKLLMLGKFWPRLYSNCERIFVKMN